MELMILYIKNQKNNSHDKVYITNRISTLIETKNNTYAKESPLNV